MSLATDKFFYNALRNSDDVIEVTDGRIFNTARPEIDEEEDKIPYIIITNEGVQNIALTKDDVIESDTDSVAVSVLIAAEDRAGLADVAQLVRDTICSSARSFNSSDAEELGFWINDYQFSTSAVIYDPVKPCHFVTFNYQCEIIKA